LYINVNKTANIAHFRNSNHWIKLESHGLEMPPLRYPCAYTIRQSRFQGHNCSVWNLFWVWLNTPKGSTDAAP